MSAGRERARLSHSQDDEGAASRTARRTRRQELQLDVSLYSDSNFYAGLTENISEGGVFVATHKLMQVGETVDLNITFPPDEQVRATGVVRWLREFNESSDANPGMGIQFVALDNQEPIEAFLKTRAPLFHEE